MIRLIFLEFECGQRAGRLPAGDLVRELLNVDQPTLAAAQVRSDGRVLLDDKYAMPAAADLQRYGLEYQDSTLQKTAKSIYLQCKPINFIHRSEPIGDPVRNQAVEDLNRWAEIAPLFENAKTIADQIVHLSFAPPSSEWERSETKIKASLLYEASLTHLKQRATRQDCFPFWQNWPE